MGSVKRHVPTAKAPIRIDRFVFYDRTKSAYAVVMTGETAKYGNVLLKKRGDGNLGDLIFAWRPFHPFLSKATSSNGFP